MENEAVKQFEAKMSEVLSKAFEQDLPKAVGLIVDNKLKELGLDKIDAKHGVVPAAFAGMSKEEMDKLDKKEKVKAFVKNVVRASLFKDIQAAASLKVMTEGTDSAGGYLVPEEYRAEVARIIEDFGLARKLCRVFPMGTDTLNLPTLSSNVTVYWPGENTAATASDLTLGRAQLLAKTAVAITVTSNELLADASVDTTQILSELMAEALAGAEDDQLFNGSGSPFTGIFGNSSVNIVTMASGQDTFAETLADDLRDVISQVKPTALSGAGFFMHRLTWGLMQKIKQNSNHVVSLAVPVIGPQGGSTGNGASAGVGGPAGTAVGYIWGYPVYLSEKIVSTTAVSTKFIAFGNLKHVFLGDRQQMTLDISNSATISSTNTFQNNDSAVRVTERVALTVGLPTGLSVLKTAAS